MSDTEIKGDNYISTSDTYVGVDSSRVLVNNAKTVGFVTFGFRPTL